MAERKQTEKEKKTVQIKATTGAWWKSKSAEQKVDVPASPGDDAKAEKPKRTPRPKKAATPPAKTEKKPTRSAAKKQAQTNTPAENVPAAGQADTETPAAPARKKPAPRKKPATPRASGIKKESPVKDTIEQGDVVALVSPDEKEKEVAQVKVEEEAAKPQSPKPRRGRRPKASAPQKAVVDTDETAAGDETTADLKSVSESPANEETEGEEAGKRGKKQSGRKKTSPEKVEEEPQEEVKKNCKLLINAGEAEECRLALLEDGRLESINVSTTSSEQRKNNIYKARIVAIEPSLQAAFVEYGTDKNGFLPFSEIHPEYFKQDLNEKVQHLVDTQQWKKLSITDVVERGQEILAQVVKEEVGKKGANMTTFLSIPGRCVVLMPGSDSSGISRKISGELRRSQLRETMKTMELPEGIGWIVRTASVAITQEALTRDVGYLLKLWEDIKGKGQALEGVGLVYEEQHSILRFLREHFDPSIQEILVDDRVALEQVKDFVQMLPEDQQGVSVRLHQGARPIFNQFSVEDQIESIYQPQVSLPSGGSIVIDPTEALVAIDVNSGSTSKGKNFEASIFQANMEAAVELARQLRLRDLGGLIVVDFIDMRSRKNITAVEKQVRAAMKKDKAKVDFSRISKFGLMEISRQKLGAPIEAGNYCRCEYCKGRGVVRSVETLSLFYLRRIQTGASRKFVENVECHFPMDVADFLLNMKRTEISEMEKRYDVHITINAERHMKPSENEIIFHKEEKESNSKKQA